MYRLRDQAPDQLRLRLEQQRSGLHAVLLERGEHDRRGRRGRQAEREQRHQHAGGGGIVGGLRARHAFDRALCRTPPGACDSFFSSVIAQEGRDLGAARRASRRTESRTRCRAATASTSAPVLRASSRASRSAVSISSRCAVVARRDVERFADREQPDRHHDDVDAVEQSGRPKVKRAWPVCRSMPTSPTPDAEEQAVSPRTARGAEHRRHRDEGQHHQREISRGPELQREIDDDRREEGERERADRAGDERADGGGGERGAGAAVRAPSCCPRAP